MHFCIGDIIHLGATKEQGRVVRLFKSGRRVGYIVATTLNGSGREIEALWFPREIKEIQERVRRYRTKAEPWATGLSQTAKKMQRGSRSCSN